jgi:glyoxylase-like metal-dependent hydrolase (beta-lactamase superfamily II)
MERIELSNRAFEGDNNAYLFDDGPETALIDTGDWLEGSEGQLRKELSDRGIEFSDIDRIFLTHWHGDHIGLASAIQAEGDATVYVHSADAPLVAGEAEAWAEMHDLQEQYFDEWAIPEDGQDVLFGLMDGSAYTEDPPTVMTIEDGDTFEINGIELEAVHAPGHAAGLCMYEAEIDGSREVFTGDALLPQYTPNVGGADVRVEQPLANYLDTLGRIADAEYDRAWPGHRDPIDDPTGRAEHIMHHHEERSWRVLDALRRLGPCNVWTISADLFGDLEHIHILHGPGESYAHLEHLGNDGLVERDGTAYRLADGVEAELEKLDEQRWPLV